jgi:hypothetical protein
LDNEHDVHNGMVVLELSFYELCDLAYATDAAAKDAKEARDIHSKALAVWNDIFRRKEVVANLYER